MNAFSLGVAVRFLLLVGAAVVAIALINAVVGREPTVAAQAPDAQPAQAKNENEKAEPAQIPLHRVVAYTAGVSYFEHQSELNGDGRLELRLGPDEINDFLRSLVVEDAGGGHIDLVTYTSSTPAARVLQSFAVNLANNPSLPELLEQVRGEEVVVRAPQPVTGAIVSVEKQEQPVNEDKVIPVHVLNLRVETGLKPIPLDTITSIEFTNPRLKEELASALETLASMHNTQEKLVQLRFSGKDRRQVRVGYVQESPVWKMTYRLVLDEKESPLIQGWAIVENTTEQNWSDVRLTLVSGQPITYRMPLYDPLFVERPVVELDLYESLRPPEYDRELKSLEREKAKLDAAAPAARANRRAGLAVGRLGEQQAQRAEAFNFRKSVQAAARGEELGKLFQYEVREPVTLARHRSAMLPVIETELKGEPLSIFEQSVHAKHPLYGLQLQNTSDLHLMEGPVSVFDDSRYAGDALMEDLGPGDESLVSYGIDLEMEVSPELQGQTRRLVSASIMNGTLHTRYALGQTHSYLVKNSAEKAKDILVVQPRQPEWELASPAASGTTRDAYHFRLSVSAGESKTLSVEQRRTLQEQIVLSNLDANAAVVYLRAESLDPQVKQALRDVIDGKQKIQNLQQQIEARENELKAIAEQQKRIRENMGEIDRNTDLYSRYVSKLGDQEDRLEGLQKELEQLREQLQTAQSELNRYISGLQLQR